MDKHEIEGEQWATRLRKLYQKWNEVEEEKRGQARAVPQGQVPPSVPQGQVQPSVPHAATASGPVNQPRERSPPAPPVPRQPSTAVPPGVAAGPNPRPRPRPKTHPVAQPVATAVPPLRTITIRKKESQVVQAPPPPRGHLRRVRSHTPSEASEEEDEEDSEEEQSRSPPPPQRKSRSKAVPETPLAATAPTAPKKPTKSTRKLVAVPTDELNDPACEECEKREVDCVINISGGACCVCRKHKRKCNYAKSRPKKETSRVTVRRDKSAQRDGPDSVAVQPVPMRSALRKTRCKCYIIALKIFINHLTVVEPVSESETPLRTKVDKGKQRATSPGPVASPPVPSVSPAPSNAQEDGPTHGPLVPPVTASTDPNVQALIAGLEDRIVYLTNGVQTMFDTMHLGFTTVLGKLGPMDRLEEKVDRLTVVLGGLAGKLDGLEQGQERPDRVPTSIPGPSASVPLTAASVPASQVDTPVQESALSSLQQPVSPSQTAPTAPLSRPDSIPPAPVVVASTSVPCPDPVPSQAMIVDEAQVVTAPPPPPTANENPAVPIPVPAQPSQQASDAPRPVSVPPVSVPPVMGSGPQVRPGVTLISPTPQNSQEELQPSTQVLVAPQLPPPDAQVTPAIVPDLEPMVPRSTNNPASTNAPLNSLPLPVPPISSGPTLPAARLVVPPTPGEQSTAAPSLRRSPRGLSPSPTPSTSSKTGDKKRKDGPGAATGSQTKKTKL